MLGWEEYEGGWGLSIFQTGGGGGGGGKPIKSLLRGDAGFSEMLRQHQKCCWRLHISLSLLACWARVSLTWHPRGEFRGFKSTQFVDLMSWTKWPNDNTLRFSWIVLLSAECRHYIIKINKLSLLRSGWLECKWSCDPLGFSNWLARAGCSSMDYGNVVFHSQWWHGGWH